MKEAPRRRPNKNLAPKTEGTNTVEAYLYGRFGEASKYTLSPTIRRRLVIFSPLVVGICVVASSLFTYNYWTTGHQINETAREYLELSSQVNNLGVMWHLAFALLVAQTCLLIIAIPGLLGRTKKSWNKLFYASFVAGVLGILYLLVPGYGFANVIGSIGLALAGLFALLQTRSYFSR